MIWTVFHGKQALGIVNEHTKKEAQAAAEERFGWTRNLDGRWYKRTVRVGHFKRVEHLTPPDEDAPLH